MITSGIDCGAENEIKDAFSTEYEVKTQKIIAPAYEGRYGYDYSCFFD